MAAYRKPFSHNLYGKYDGIAKDTLTSHLESEGHILVNDKESYAADLITQKDGETYFNEAEIIVGAHGAGLCNLIFCSPKTRIIELTSHNYKCDVFRNISSINNLNYFNLISSKNIPANGLNPDIYISEKDLTNVIMWYLDFKICLIVLFF